MMEKQQVFIYGASGHSKVIIEIAEALGYPIGGLVDANPKIRALMGYPVASPHNMLDREVWIIGIGNNAIRKRINLEQHLPSITLIHPSANLSKRAKIGGGTVIMAGASINAEVKIGKHCIVNTNASVDHDCEIEDYVHISPNAALAGNVTIGEGTHIGIGACIIQGIEIGNWCTVGAGAVVIQDVPDGATVVGNPARVIRVKEGE